MANRTLLRGTVLAGLLLALGASCGTADEIAEYCEEACDCYGCSDDELDVCIAEYERGLAIAEAYECEQEYLEELACRAKKSECDEDDRFRQDCSADGCPCDRDEDDYDECVEDASKIKTRCECTCDCEFAADVPGGACVESSEEDSCCWDKCTDVCAAGGHGTSTGGSGHCYH